MGSANNQMQSWTEQLKMIMPPLHVVNYIQHFLLVMHGGDDGGMGQKYFLSGMLALTHILHITHCRCYVAN